MTHCHHSHVGPREMGGGVRSTNLLPGGLERLLEQFKVLTALAEDRGSVHGTHELLVTPVPSDTIPLFWPCGHWRHVVHYMQVNTYAHKIKII